MSAESKPGRDKRGKKSRARSAARLAAVQALYQMEMAGTPVAQIIPEFESYRFGEEMDGLALDEADPDYFERIMRGVIANQVEIDQLTDKVLAEGWPLARVDNTLRALFRAGGFELMGSGDVPVKVVIDEYLHIAHAFFFGDEPGLVNGVLDSFARARGLTSTEDQGAPQ